MTIAHNFYADQGALPKSVLTNIESDLLSYQESGISIVEFSHDHKHAQDLIEDTLLRFRIALRLNDSWELLLLQGAGALQFAMAPYNLSKVGDRIDYIDTGYWTQQAIAEAQYCQRDLQVIASGKSSNYRALPEIDPSFCGKDAKYLHICSNNTIEGTQWEELPEVGIPIVVDASSDLLSRKFDITNVNMIYAHTQKNIGLSGMTVVAVRKNAIVDDSSLPNIMRYKSFGEGNSNFHMPPVFSIYVTNLMLHWLEREMGGVEAISQINRQKSALLYEAIDNSQIFDAPVVQKYRSDMNVVFTTGDDELDEQFVSHCTEVGIVGVGGHRSQKGLRASLYNAVTLDDVNSLIDAIQSFEYAKSYMSVAV